MDITRTLKNKEIIESAGAIAALDAADEKGKSLFEFDPKARAAFSKRLRRLKELASDIESVRIRLIADAGITGAKDKEDAMASQRFGAKWHDMQEATCEPFDMASIKYEWLKPDKNQIPVWVLTALAWLIDGMPED